MNKSDTKNLFCLFLICCLFFGCSGEIKKCSKYIITGKYQNKAKTETIIILDSVNYIHQYQINEKVKSDTSTYWFSSTFEESNCLNTIMLHNFHISDSTFYWTHDSYRNSSFSLVYNEFDYYTKVPIMRVELDDANNVIIFKCALEKGTQ